MIAKIFRNRLIPFPGYVAMTFAGRIWTRKEKLNAQTLRHESIHIRQEAEMLYLGFCLWYMVEYLFIRVIQYRFDFNKAYRNISFEREAYANEDKEGYLGNREFWAFLIYL